MGPSIRSPWSAVAVVSSAALAFAALAPASSGADVDVPVTARQAYAVMKPTPLKQTWAAPDAMAVTPNGKVGVVAGRDGIERLKLTKSPAKVTGRHSAEAQDVVARNGYAYTFNPLELEVWDISGKKPKRVRVMPNATLDGQPPQDLALTPNGKFLYVSYGLGPAGGRTGVRVLSLAKPRKPKPVGNLKLRDDVPVGLGITPNGTTLLVSTFVKDRLLFVNIAKPKKPRVMKSRRIGFRSFAIATARGNKWAYVLGENRNRLLKVNVRKRKVARTISLGTNKYGGAGLAISPDGKYLMAGIYESVPDVSLFLVKTKTMKKTKVANTFNSPNAVAVSRTGKTKGRFYVAADAESPDSGESITLMFPFRRK